MEVAKRPVLCLPNASMPTEPVFVFKFVCLHGCEKMSYALPAVRQAGALSRARTCAVLGLDAALQPRSLPAVK
eukprot:5802357-Pleurochrysis_carterae.AAC.1